MDLLSVRLRVDSGGVDVMPPTAEERAEIREDHPRLEWHGEVVCERCGVPWPCPTRRTLDALDAAEAVLRDIGLWASEHATRLAGSSGNTHRFFDALAGFEHIASAAHTALADAGAQGRTP